jgi:predicted ATPase
MEKPYDKYDKPFKYLEVTPYRSHIYSPSEHNLVPFDEAVSADTGRLFKDAEKAKAKVVSETLNPPDEVEKQNQSLRLARMRFYNEYPVPSWARSLLSNLYCYPGFDVSHFSKVRTQPAEIQPLTALHQTGENLGTVLHEILTRADYRPVAEDIREFLRTAYPFFDDIFAETTFGAPPKVLVRIREKGMQRSMELWDLSDGMLRFLCLVAAMLNPVPPAFIAIDEPEAGLHPKLLPVVADLIKAACERTQILVTTHSPDLLNRFELDNVAVLVREENKIRWTRPGTNQSLRTMLQTVTSDSLGDMHRSGELEAL